MKKVVIAFVSLHLLIGRVAQKQAVTNGSRMVNKIKELPVNTGSSKTEAKKNDDVTRFAVYN